MARAGSQLPFRLNNVPSLTEQQQQIEYLVREVNRVFALVSTAIAQLSGGGANAIELRADLDLDGHEIRNIAAPTADKSATNKEFVDTQVENIRDAVEALAEEVNNTGSLSGAGTVNVVSKFTAPSVLGDSTITDTGTLVRTTANVGIGTVTTPAAPLEISAATPGGHAVIRNTTETVAQTANLYFLTGAAGEAIAHTNTIVHFEAEITQADPSALIGEFIVRVNGGDNTDPVLRLTGTRNMGLSQSTFGSSATDVFAIGNGTPPGSSPANATQLYSADQIAGNACLHTRTENGAIVKLYQESALTAEDATAIDATYDGVEQAVLNNVRTRVGEIETALQNIGLLA
jgi:hypothetical protein